MTVVLVDPRRPSLIPVEAIEFLAGDVQYTEEMPVKVPWSLPSARPAYEGDDAPTLLSSDRDHPAVKARLAAGDKLIAAPDPQPGERLVDAVAMMDKLRTDRSMGERADPRFVAALPVGGDLRVVRRGAQRQRRRASRGTR